MGQTKYDIYEFLLKDKNEILDKIRPGANIFLNMEKEFAGKERYFNAAFEEYIIERLIFLISTNLGLNYEEISCIIDLNLDDNLSFYLKKETYL